MPNNHVFAPDELAELQRVYDDVTVRLAKGGYRIPVSEISKTVIHFAVVADSIQPIALEANVYGHLTYDG